MSVLKYHTNRYHVNKGHPTGILVNYLMDRKHVFTSELAKNITKLANNLSHDHELAKKRFEEVRSFFIFEIL